MAKKTDRIEEIPTGGTPHYRILVEGEFIMMGINSSDARLKARIAYMTMRAIGHEVEVSWPEYRVRFLAGLFI